MILQNLYFANNTYTYIHNFQRDAKFTIIEQIKNLNKEKQDKRKILENKEDFWILKLKTLQPNGLNDKINHPQEIPGLIF